MAREDSTQNLDELLDQNILSERAFRSRFLLAGNSSSSAAAPAILPELPAAASQPKRARTEQAARQSTASTSASASAPAFLSIENPEWSLPPGVAGALISQGITHLHPWQAAALRLATKKPTANLVVSAPTSGGKSLVADVLLLRALSRAPGSRALIILPYTALVQQKAAALGTLLGCINTVIPEHQPRVRALYGSKGSPRFGSSSVLVTTPERALGVIARLADAEHDQGQDKSRGAGARLSDLSFVCVDEVHLVGDAHRGANLEALLSLLVFCGRNSERGDASTLVGNSPAQQGKCGLQILGMSATLQNSRQVAQWLRAQHFVASARPTSLSVRVVLNGVVYDTGSDQQQELARLEVPAGAVGAGAVVWQCAVALLRQAWAARQNTIVFFPSKDKARLSVERLNGAVESFFPAWAPSQQLRELASKSCIAALSKPLRQAFRAGVGLHHAGLDAECREVMAGAFEARLLHTLCCTSSLAAGVNLPADKVIITSLKLGATALDATRLSQMVGRAGRFGLSESGEAFILAESVAAKAAVLHMLHSGPAAVRSNLLPDGAPPAHKGNFDVFTRPVADDQVFASDAAVYAAEPSSTPALALQRMVLCAVGYGLVWDLLSLWDLMRCTLCASLNDWSKITGFTLSALSHLLQEGHCMDTRLEPNVASWRRQVLSHLRHCLGQAPQDLAAEMGQVATDDWLEGVLKDFPAGPEAKLPRRPTPGEVRLCSISRQPCLCPSKHGSAAANAVLTSSEASVLADCCSAVLGGVPTVASLAGLLFCVPVGSCPVRITSTDSLSSRILELHEADIALLGHFGMPPSAIMTLPQLVPSKVGIPAQRVHSALLLRHLLDGHKAEDVLQQAGLPADAIGQLQRLLVESIAFGASAKEFCVRVLDVKRGKALAKLIDTQRQQLKRLSSGRYAAFARSIGACSPVAAALSRQGFKTIEDVASAHPREMAFGLLREAPWVWPLPSGHFVVPPKGQQRYSLGGGSTGASGIGDSPVVLAGHHALESATSAADTFSNKLQTALEEANLDAANSVDDMLSGIASSVLQNFPTTPQRAAAQRNALKTSQSIHFHLVAERSAWAKRAVPSSRAGTLAPVATLDCTIAADRWLRSTESCSDDTLMVQPTSIVAVQAGADCSAVHRKHAAAEGLPVHLSNNEHDADEGEYEAEQGYDSDSSDLSVFSDASSSSSDLSIGDSVNRPAVMSDAHIEQHGVLRDSADSAERHSWQGDSANHSTKASSRIIHSLLLSQHGVSNRSSASVLSRSLLSPAPKRLGGLADSGQALDRSVADAIRHSSSKPTPVSSRQSDTLAGVSSFSGQTSATAAVHTASGGLEAARLQPLWPELLSTPLVSLQCVSLRLPVFCDAQRWQWALSPSWKVVSASTHSAHFEGSASRPAETPVADSLVHRAIAFGSASMFRGVIVTAWLGNANSFCGWLHLPPPSPRRLEWEGSTACIEIACSDHEVSSLALPVSVAVHIFSFLGFEAEQRKAQTDSVQVTSSAPLGSCCRSFAAAHSLARNDWYQQTIPQRWQRLQQFVLSVEGRIVLENSTQQLKELQCLGIHVPGSKIVDPAVCSWILDPDEHQNPRMEESIADFFAAREPGVLQAAVADTLAFHTPDDGLSAAVAEHCMAHAKVWAEHEQQVSQGARSGRQRKSTRRAPLAPLPALAEYSSTAFALIASSARRTWEMQRNVTVHVVNGPLDALRCSAGLCGTWESCWGCAHGTDWQPCARLRRFWQNTGSPEAAHSVVPPGAASGSDMRDAAAQRGLAAVVCTAVLLSAASAGGMLTVVLEREMPLRSVLALSELHGVVLDKRSCVQLHVLLKETVAAVDAAANKLLPPGSRVDLQSFASVSLAVKQLCHTVGSSEAEGLSCAGFSSEVLESLKQAAESTAPAVRDLVVAVLAHRQASSLLHQVQSLHSPAKWEAVSRGFKLHPSSNALSATGRISMSNPSVQMIPKDYEHPVATNVSVQDELDLGILPPDGLLLQSQAAAQATNASATFKASASQAASAANIVLRSCLVHSVGSAVCIGKPALAAGGTSGPVPTAAGTFDFAQQPLVEYWRKHGFAYSESDAQSIAQAVVRFGGAHSGVCLSVPADQVFRKMADRSFSLHAFEDSNLPLTARPALPQSARANLRSYIKASPGFVLLSADYSQVELRVLASLSQDQTLCSILQAGDDVFGFVVEQWHSMGLSNTTDAARQLDRAAAKRLVYGLLYGMGDRQLATSLGVTLGLAVRLRDAFLQMFPGVKAFLARTVAECRGNGFVTTLAGRKRFLPAITSSNFAERLRAERQAVNTVCQGSAADILKLAMLKLHESLGHASPAPWQKASQAHPVSRAKPSLPVSTGAGPAASFMQKDPSFTGVSSAKTASQGGRSPWVCPATQLQLPPQAVYAVRLVLHIHDEIMLEVPDNAHTVAATKRLLAHCMQDAVALKVPLVVSMCIGEDWGSMAACEQW